jgi:DNA (cytosine-5)-methyltransferase 1
MMLVLSLFPGIGLLDMAFELEGFTVVRGPDVLWGGDIRRFHPPAGKFDVVIGGPPCQAFSSLAHMVRHNGYEPKFGNLIPEFERVVDATQPLCFLMEEVPKAPVPNIASYGVHEFILNNRQLGEDQNRVRRISFGWRGGRKVLMVDVVALESRNFEYAACGGTHGEGGISREQREDTPAAARARARKRGVPVAVGGSGKLKPAARRITLNDCVGNNVKSTSSYARLCELQGLPPDFLSDAPFTVAGKCKAVGNGVPLPMGRAIARAVKEAMQFVP